MEGVVGENFNLECRIFLKGVKYFFLEVKFGVYRCGRSNSLQLLVGRKKNCKHNHSLTFTEKEAWK